MFIIMYLDIPVSKISVVPFVNSSHGLREDGDAHLSSTSEHGWLLSFPSLHQYPVQQSLSLDASLVQGACLSLVRRALSTGGSPSWVWPCSSICFVFVFLLRNCG